MVFLTAVQSIASVVLVIALGFYLRGKGWFSDSFSADISRLLMNAALPASIFVSVLTYLSRDKLLSLSAGLVYGASSVVLGLCGCLAGGPGIKGEARPARDFD